MNLLELQAMEGGYGVRGLLHFIAIAKNYNTIIVFLWWHNFDLIIPLIKSHGPQITPISCCLIFVDRID